MVLQEIQARLAGADAGAHRAVSPRRLPSAETTGQSAKSAPSSQSVFDPSDYRSRDQFEASVEDAIGRFTSLDSSVLSSLGGEFDSKNRRIDAPMSYEEVSNAILARRKSAAQSYAESQSRLDLLAP